MNTLIKVFIMILNNFMLKIILLALKVILVSKLIYILEEHKIILMINNRKFNTTINFSLI